MTLPYTWSRSSTQTQTVTRGAFCANTVSLLGNAAGAGTGEWTVTSVPAGTSSVIVAPANLTEVGTYRFVRTITTPSRSCEGKDTVSFGVTVRYHYR